MDDIYKINDNRLMDDFKIKTFSGYKKSDVINTLFKSIEQKKVENACNWTIECIISGYTMQLWEKLLIFSCKVVHINNPRLPIYLLNKNIILNNQLKRLNVNDKNIVLILRDSQMIRNLFFDVISTLTMSNKTKKYDKLPKINEKEDFDFSNIKTRMKATMNIIPNYILKFDDPDELKIIINEIYFNLKNKLSGYDRSCYWILWLLHWEKLHKKNKNNWNVGMRDVQVRNKYKNDVIWVIWDTINEEVKFRLENKNNEYNNNIKKYIDSLFGLYIYNYSSGKRNVRLPYIFNAIGYLTHNIDFKIPLRCDMCIFIQTQSKVNKMFKDKKICEVNNPIVKKVEGNKKLTSEKEIILDKLSIFNSFD
jgi:hypothetical protein